MPEGPSQGKLCNCYSTYCHLIGQTYTENRIFPCPWTLIKVNPTPGNGVIIEANQINTNDNTKSKLNVALLKQKLQEAKALQQKNLLAGNIVDKEQPPIAKIVAHKAKATEHTQNEAVHGPTAGANPQVLN
jgi:hypothetical protein